MDQSSLKDYRRGLEAVLATLLKAHKELKFLAQVPGKLDLTVRGGRLVEASNFTMLLEKSAQDIVALGRAINSHRSEVEQLLRTAAELDDEGERLTAAINDTILGGDNG